MSKGEDVKLREKVVQYIGLSDVRVIYEGDWASIGIEHGEVKWDETNNWTVLAEDLSEEVLEYCQRDRELAIVSR